MKDPLLNVEKIKKLKKNWIRFTLGIALIMPFVGWLILKDWSLYTDALSDFGMNPKTAGIWAIYLIFMAVGIWLNGSTCIENKFEGVKSYILYNILNISSVSLGLVSIISNSYQIMHGIVAGVFFISYALFIFLYGLWLVKRKLREGVFSVVVAFLLLLTILFSVPVSGLALFEISYILILMLWNYIIIRPTLLNKIINIFGK